MKIILCLPYCIDKEDDIRDMLKRILNQPWWEKSNILKIIDKSFNKFNDDEIINNIITFLRTKIYDSVDSLTNLDLIIFDKILNVIINNIESIHHVNFIDSIIIFYDGIPSFSKIIEQRRRRIKNYIESVEKKKLIKNYFDKLDNVNKKLIDNIDTKYMIIDSELSFDYFKWTKYRFSIEKSFGPTSNFIKKFEIFIKEGLTNYFSKINIVINSASENGESDFKIFKYISLTENAGDYCIHTTDSDFIHQILVQQSYYKIINKDINLSVIRYIKNQNSSGYIQMIDANYIIKNILDLYSNINNVQTNNYKIIWDLCIIFLFFGNDHLPSSVEIGPELGLEYFIKIHYKALKKDNIICFKKSYINMDLQKLELLLSKIYETNDMNITKIILQRFFKINNNFVNFFVERLKLNFNEIQDFLKIFIINRGLSLSKEEFEKLDEDDLRKKLVLNNMLQNSTPQQYNLSEDKINIINDSIKLIEEYIDYTEEKYMGLTLYVKNNNINYESI
jgi:hypothetical protein